MLGTCIHDACVGLVCSHLCGGFVCMMCVRGNMPEFFVFLRVFGCLKLLSVKKNLNLVGTDGAVSDNESLEILESEQGFEDDAGQRHVA